MSASPNINAGAGVDAVDVAPAAAKAVEALWVDNAGEVLAASLTPKEADELQDEFNGGKSPCCEACR